MDPPYQDAYESKSSSELLPFGELVFIVRDSTSSHPTHKPEQNKKRGESGLDEVSRVDEWTKTTHTSLSLGMVNRLHELSANFL